MIFMTQPLRERNVESKTWSGSPLKVPEGARFLIRL